MRHAMNSLVVAAGFIVTAQAFAQKLTFEEAIRRASERASERERAQLAVAVTHERYLETQSKFRLELRPRIGLLSFSNPALLASSVGLGMVMGRNQPSEWVRQNARLDALTAEVAVERAVMNARLEVTRRYFDVFQREDAEKHLKAAARQHEDARRKLEQRSKSNGATAIDGAAWELRLIATETQLEEASEGLAQARSALAALVGAEGSPDSLQLASWEKADMALDIPDRTMLRQAVIGRKDSQGGVMEKLENEKNRLRRRSGGPGVTPLSLGYTRLSDHRQAAASMGQSGYLLGGHTGTVDLGVKIPLRKTGEDEALRAYAVARIRLLELELEANDAALLRELESLRTQVVSSKRKAEAAARKLKVVADWSRSLALREQVGLESTEAVMNAEAELARTRLDLLQSQGEAKTRYLQLRAACELDNPNPADKLLVGQAHNVTGNTANERLIP